MGDLLFVVLVVVGLVTFFYRKGQVAQVSCSESVASDKLVVEEVVVEEETLQRQILLQMMDVPGILQTELYKLFPHENRKHLQATLLQMDRDNVLRRDKIGSSYRLFPH